MAVVGAGGDEIRCRQLSQFLVVAALHILEHFHPRLPAPGIHPAQAQAGGQDLVQRGTVNDIAVPVPGFQCLERRVVVAEGAVGVVFDQRNLVCSTQLDQVGFLGIRHDAAEGVLQVRNDDQRLDLFAGLDGQLQRFERNAAVRTGRDFQGAQAECLEYLEQSEKGRRFDGDDIAGLRNGPQRQVESFDAALSDQDLLRRQQHAVGHCSFGQGVAEGDIAVI